jgi:hypothetical protein
VSQRRACRVMDRSRSVVRYRPRHRVDEPPLCREIKRLARRHPRYGYRRIHALLVRTGWSVNIKRVRRLWNTLGLRRPLRLRKSRKLGPKPGTSANSCVQQPAQFKNDAWTCDFVHDRTASGRPLKWLTVVDEYTRECLVLHADSSVTGADVRRIVARVIGRRGAPRRIRSDNGSESICEALANWLPGMGTEPNRSPREAPGRTDTSSHFTVVCVTSFWSGRNSRTYRTLVQRGLGTAGNITGSGLTVHRATQRRKSLVQRATRGGPISVATHIHVVAFSCSKQSPICAGPQNGEQGIPGRTRRK